MHSGRSEATHSSQQPPQRISPLASGTSNSNTNVPPGVSTAPTSHQPSMLSAGQPAISSGLFRSSADIPSPTQRLSGGGTGASSYLPSSYSTIYGVHNQSPSHMSPTMQQYNAAAFLPPQFGGTAGTSTHGFSHSPLLATSSAGHYHFESYSAMLASMGSQVQQRATQGAELNRSPRLSGQGSSGGTTVQSQPTSYMSLHSASGGSYTTVSTSASTPPSHLPGSNPPSPSTSHTGLPPSRLDASHPLDKLTPRKTLSQDRRTDPDSLRTQHYDAASSLENKHSQPSVAGCYSMGEHVQKVSFDSVVKEYGGGRNSPPGQDYLRSHLSGKEGSLKHRILIRPSDTEDDLEKGSPGGQDIKDEPVFKRFKSQSAAGLTTCHMEEILNPSHHYSVAYTDRPLIASSSLSGGGVENKLRSNSAFVHDKTNPSLVFQQNKGPVVPAARVSPPPTHYYHSVHTSQPAGGLDKHHDKIYAASTAIPTQEPAPLPATSSPSNQTSASANPEGSHLQYPMHFMKGSIIQLADGSLKRVEELQTEDFISSAEISADLKVDSSRVEKIEEQQDKGTAMLSFSVGEHKVQVTVEATLEHPFFVFERGWSSCSVSRTLARYGLDCQKLCVGDVCISLTQKDVDLCTAEQKPATQSDTHRPVAALSPVSQNPSMTSAAGSTQHERVEASSIQHDRVEASALFVASTSSSSPSPSSMAQTMRRRTSQADLPPPLTNIVPVKKETHVQYLRGSHNGEGQGKECDKDEEEDVKSLHKRVWPGQDHTSFKLGSDMDRDRKLRVKDVKSEDGSEGNS